MPGFKHGQWRETAVSQWQYNCLYTEDVILYLTDNIIKVWRLFPFAVEALAPLMSFYCAHTPLYMTIMRRKLYVAFQDEKTATYSVVLYSLADKSKCENLSSRPLQFNYRIRPIKRTVGVKVGKIFCRRDQVGNLPFYCTPQ